MALRVLPDAEALAVQWLLAHTDLDVSLGNRIYTEVPASPVYPLAVVRRIGGLPVVRQHLDVARLQIDGWAETKKAAFTTTASVLAALHELEGQTRPEGVVTAVSDDLGLTWLPDELTDRPRYVAGVALHVHPIP